MKRYKKANEGIHAPEEAKEKAARPAGGRGYNRWTGAVAAVLAVAIIGSAAAWAGRRAGTPSTLSNEDPGWTEPTAGNDLNEPAPLSEDTPGNPPAASGRSYGNGSHYTYALATAGGFELPPRPEWKDLEIDPTTEDGHEAWLKANEAWREAAGLVYTGLDGIENFVTASTARFLTGPGEENRVYSPLNLYMALAMLAETAGGDSRQQILDVLGEDSIETLRKNATAVWRNHYQDDDMGISVMANSLWLRDDMTYDQTTLDTLSANYYASSFAGEMGSEVYNQALQDWVNEQTRGVLTEQADGLFFDPRTVLGLASTLYFKSAWSDPFDPELNTREVFHAPSGDVETEFLHTGEWFKGDYYWGEHFSAICLRFQASNYSMWLVLPDEGYTVDELLESGEAMEFLLANKNGDYDEETDEFVGGWPGQVYRRINLSLPKFDVSSDLELSDGLKALGVTDVFDPGVSDFSPLGASTNDPIYVSQAQHAARVMIDEEGCTAASYVNLMLAGAGMPPDEIVDFILNRPFLFAITGDSGLPLFLGVVNQPIG